MTEKKLCEAILSKYANECGCVDINCSMVHAMSEEKSLQKSFRAMYKREEALFFKTNELHYGEFLEWLELRNDNRKKTTIFKSYDAIEQFNSKKFFRNVFKCQQYIFGMGKIVGQDCEKKLIEIKSGMNCLERISDSLREAKEVANCRNMSCRFINSGSYGTVYLVTRFNDRTNSMINLAEKQLKHDIDRVGHEGFIRESLGSDVIEGIVTHVCYSGHSILMRYYDKSLWHLAFRISSVEKKRLMPLILKQLCSGLVTLEKNGLFHNDISPGNILVNYNPLNPCDLEVLEAVLGDLGAVRKHPATELTTNYYRPPEKQKDLDKAVNDIYSLGLCMLEFISSAEATEAYKVNNHTIPMDYPIRDVLFLMISPTYSLRPSATEILAALSKKTNN